MCAGDVERPKVLLVHERVLPHGGGQAVAAWTIEAQKSAVDLTVLSWKPPDTDGLNRLFGTGIAESDVRSEWIDPRVSRAGCVPFVRDSGGAREIVGFHPARCFADEDDAVAKIDRVLGSPALEDEVRRALDSRRDLFTEVRFVQAMRDVVLTQARTERAP